MKGRYPLPQDLPAAACGRCLWFKLTKNDGYGQCLVRPGQLYYYKCMVCAEYEQDPNPGI